MAKKRNTRARVAEQGTDFEPPAGGELASDLLRQLGGARAVEATERHRRLVARHEELVDVLGADPPSVASAAPPRVKHLSEKELDELLASDRGRGPLYRQLAAMADSSELVFTLTPLQVLKVLATQWAHVEDAGTGPIPVHHLVYAYMIENTRIYEIFDRVLYEFAHGERLEVPSAETQQWARTTESIFYKEPPPADYGPVTSWLRPDVRASRRNAYYRMFGMELNHGTADNRPYGYERAQTANREFMATFEEFLREVWRAIENTSNIVAANPTDESAIAALAEDLFDMLTTRRRDGNLLREEFFYVATMAWLHVAVNSDSPIVHDLRAEASSPEERLKTIGDRVEIPADGRSRSYFLIAEPLSRVLRQLETGDFHAIDAVPVFYLPTVNGQANPVAGDMKTIITQWGIATGRDLKAPRAAVVPRGAVPPGIVLGGNGTPPAPELPAPPAATPVG